MTSLQIFLNEREARIGGEDGGGSKGVGGGRGKERERGGERERKTLSNFFLVCLYGGLVASKAELWFRVRGSRFRNISVVAVVVVVAVIVAAAAA